LNLIGERSLLQQALDRLAPLAPPERTWVITSAAQRDLVAEQLPELPADRIVAEPVGRDTAACIGLGAALVAAEDPDAVMVVTPADHVIEPAASFQRTVLAAAQLAEEHPHALVTFGIAPTYPATGYGYIHRGEPVPGRSGVEAFRIVEFKEKPDAATAERYLRSGRYAWNSGIFVWRAAAIHEELERLKPDLFAAVERIAQAWRTPQREAVFRREYEPLQKTSIDFAVMEHCRVGLTLQAPFVWDDVGSWPALARHYPQDAAGNTVVGAQHIGLDTRNCLIAGDGNGARVVTTVGVENLLIVQDGDAVLVADRRDEAAIKKLVEHLKAKGLERYL
jgi:mannose-1-phosphate guanylyltransferase